MMRKVYLSFLGAGNYNETIYHIDGQEAQKSEYVQCAEINILGKDYFDICFFVITPTSMEKHYNKLKQELTVMGVKNVLPIQISEELDAQSQWRSFESILKRIEPKDKLTIDMTHGFRAIPIILSTAINFLQKSKDVEIEAVYYGAYEKNKELSPIIDMKEFYIINEWADAVSRLVEDADARKMADIASQAHSNQIRELNDEQIIAAFKELTNAVRNVDINNISPKAAHALNLIQEKKKIASTTGELLLDLVIDKYISLTSNPVTGKYDKNYFIVQLKIIDLLLEHKLFMQAFTVMREFIGSIGLIEVKKANILSSKGRQQRRKADFFIKMLTHDEDKWKFDERDYEFVAVKPFYDKLKTFNIESILREFCKELTDYRNGFDHAWTSKQSAFLDIEEKGKLFFQNLNDVISKMENNQIL